VLGDGSTAVDNSIVAPLYRGIDVIGDSPILRRNSVVQAGKAPLHVEDFERPDGSVARANPFRDANSFDQHETAAVADDSHSAAELRHPLAP
jgi:hypothetical protein